MSRIYLSHSNLFTLILQSRNLFVFPGRWSYDGDLGQAFGSKKKTEFTCDIQEPGGWKVLIFWSTRIIKVTGWDLEKPKKDTPQKSNIDTKNCHFLRVPLPFPKHHFGALWLLVFGGVHGDLHLASPRCWMFHLQDVISWTGPYTPWSLTNSPLKSYRDPTGK